jgi:hypothetical protein
VNDDDIKREIPLLPSTIETIDVGFYDWVDKELDLHVTSNSGWKKVPCLWLSAERSFQIKNNKDLRDSAGKLKLPLISVMRTSMTKDPTFRGSHYSHIYEDGDYKGGATPIAKRIQQIKTRNFANSQVSRQLKNRTHTGRFNNKKIVYETIEIPVPTYVSIMYDVTIRTEYLQQMNTLVLPFITKTGGINNFFFENEGHRYEGFIQQDFNPDTNVKSLGDDERFFETKIQIKVLAHLLGEGPNREKPKAIIRENQVEVQISRERVILGDTQPWNNGRGKYRE